MKPGTAFYCAITATIKDTQRLLLCGRSKAIYIGGCMSVDPFISWDISHRKYLQSKQFKAVRQIVLERDGYACNNCETRRGIKHCWHIRRDNYKIGGEIEAGDCVLLCSRCLPDKIVLYEADLRVAKYDAERWDLFRQYISAHEGMTYGEYRNDNGLNLIDAQGNKWIAYIIAGAVQVVEAKTQ